MKKTYIKYSIYEIKNSIKRFLTLVILSLLGIGFFVGIKALCDDMKDTVDTYSKKQNMYDIKIVSNLGLEEEDISKLKELSSIQCAYGTYTCDAYVKNQKNVTYTMKVNAITNYINKLAIIEGRMPESIDECVVEENYVKQNNVIIGDYLELEVPEEKIQIDKKRMRIVGIVKSPLYISRERGFSSIGNGKIKYFLYIKKENFTMDFFTDIYVNLNNPKNINVLSQEYETILKQGQEEINKIVKERTDARTEKLTQKYIEDKKEEREKNPLSKKNESFMDKNIREETEKRIGVGLTQEELLELTTMEKCYWDINTKLDNLGIISLKRDSQSIEKLALVFPVIFFLLAILVISTTMHRMVEEQRNTIGVLKYIGYSDNLIVTKYLIYVTIAVTIGGIIGICIGNKLIPNVVWKAYSLMYSIKSSIITEINITNIIVGFVCMIISSYLATIYTVKKYINTSIAELMRNKEEKIGKKIPEKTNKKIEKLSFKRQLLIKNIIRYKKRFIITIIGVAGSISLVIAGFGLYDSISQILEYQTRKVYNYDIEINLNDRLTEYYLQEETTEIQKMEGISSCIQVYMREGTLHSDNGKEEIQIIIPKDNKEFEQYMTLRDKNNEIYEIQDDSIAITQKVAEMLRIREGDIVQVEISNKKKASFKVDAIVKNYVSHYIYISKHTYVENLGGYTLNTIYAKREKNLNQQQKDKLNKEIIKRENVKYLLDTDSLEKLIDDQIDSLNYAVIVLIISSGVLNFTVQYNLYNITLSERKKELMILKILGYSYKKIYSYMNFENILSTLLGILVGLISGTIISKFIVNLCEPNYFKFVNTIKMSNYICSILITIIFSIIINISIYFAMKKIDYVRETKNYD